MSDKPLDQASIDALLRTKRGKSPGPAGGGPGGSMPSAPPSAPAEPPAAGKAGPGVAEPVQGEAPRDGEPAGAGSPGPDPVAAARGSTNQAALRREVSAAISEVPVEIAVVLGDLEMPIADVLKLQPGSIVQLEALADLPVEIRLRGRTVARAQVVVVEDNYGLRIVENLVATPDFPPGPRP